MKKYLENLEIDEFYDGNLRPKELKKNNCSKYKRDWENCDLLEKEWFNIFDKWYPGESKLCTAKERKTTSDRDSSEN
jgi:hypothetical protein